MGKPLKIIIAVVAVLVVLLAGAFLFLRSYLTDERIRTLVVENAEKSLNRKVLLGAIDLSLFKGIVVRDIEVKERDAKTAFLRAKEFGLSYQFLPLLSKRLVIDKLSLVNPEIHVWKNADATYNFSDISAPAPKTPETERGKPAGLPVSLNVERIAIEQAKLHYTDLTGKLKKADVLVTADLGISSASEKALSSSGKLDITIATAVLASKEDTRTLKDISADIRYKVDVNPEAKQVTIHSVDASVLKIPIQIRGSVTYGAEAGYALDLTVPNVALSELRKDILSAFLPEGTALGGNLSMALNAVRKPGKDSPATYKGSIRMSKVSVLYKGLQPVLDGSVRLTQDAIAIEGMRLISGQNSADITGSVKNYIAYPDADIAIRSRSLALDDLVVPAPAAPQKQEAPKTEAAGKEPEPMNLKMRLNATLDIDKTTYRGIAITHFRSRYELKDNVFRILSLNGSTLSGAFALKGAVDLAQKGYRYNISPELKNMKVEELVNAFAPKAKGKLFGTLSGNADIAGAGTLAANVKRNLKGKGAFAIKDGSLKNAELSSGLLAILGLQELREIPIQTADGKFTMADGIVNLKTLIASRDMTIDETGTIGMDEKLDLGVLVKISDRLSPKVVSQSPVARLLSGEKGWTGIPLRVAGTISNPSYGIDTRAVGQKAGQAIQKRLGEELLKRLPGGESKSQPQAPTTEQKKSLTPEDLFKGLFGK